MRRYGLTAATAAAAAPRGRRGGFLDPHGAADGERDQEDRRDRERRRDPDPRGERRHDDGCRGDAERLRHLPDAHRETPTLAREPAHHHASARCARARRRGPREPENDAERQEVVHEHGDEREHRRQQQTARDDSPLAVAVGGGAPCHERQHHADGGCGRQQPGFGERQAALQVQERDEVDRDAHQQRARRLGRDAEHEHAPGLCGNRASGDGVHGGSRNGRLGEP